MRAEEWIGRWSTPFRNSMRYKNRHSFPTEGFDLMAYIDELTAEFIREALARTRHNIGLTAELLKMSPAQLRNLIRRLNIEV